MFYRQHKTFWYQFCNLKHFLKAENSEDIFASSCEQNSVTFHVTQTLRLSYYWNYCNPWLGCYNVVTLTVTCNSILQYLLWTLSLVPSTTASQIVFKIMIFIHFFCRKNGTYIEVSITKNHTTFQFWIEWDIFVVTALQTLRCFDAVSHLHVTF